MKLFSAGGNHATAGKRFRLQVVPKGNLLADGDEWKIVGLLLFSFVTCGWMLSGLKDVPEEPVPVETEVVASVPVAEEVELITIDQTEALAMGIDAVISSEVKGEWVSDTTLLMVGNVIMNRTNDSRYPDTVDQVLTQPYQFSCFSTAGLKWVGKAANDMAFRDRCIAAAEAVMNGERLLNYGVVYVSSSQQGTVEAQLDGLYFCK